MKITKINKDEKPLAATNHPLITFILLVIITSALTTIAIFWTITPVLIS